MKTLLITSLLVLFSACAASTRPARTAPAPVPAPVAGGVDSPCPDWGCGTNGTQVTGLSDDRAGTIETIALPSGEVITPR